MGTAHNYHKNASLVDTVVWEQIKPKYRKKKNLEFDWEVEGFKWL